MINFTNKIIIYNNKIKIRMNINSKHKINSKINKYKIINLTIAHMNIIQKLQVLKYTKILLMKTIKNI